jgi:hypothetical protein
MRQRLNSNGASSFLALALLVLAAGPSWSQSGTWSEVGTTNSPGPRRQYGSVFDSANQLFYLFDGFNGNNQGLYVLFNDVWALSVNGTPEWTDIPISGALPGERHSPQWGYDAARNRVLIFGGYGSHYPDGPYEYLNDVWQLSLDGAPQWTEITPSGQAPSGRLAGAAVFDPMRQRFVGFGGTVGVPTDTWVLNLQGIDQANWENLPTLGVSPSARYGPTSVYDAKRDRMIIFGGSTSDAYYGALNDVWELDLREDPTWREIETAGTPPVARRSGTAIYDPLRDRMIIYGGATATPPDTDAFLSDAWALDFSVDPPTWSQLSPGGATPIHRDCMAATYDPIHDRMITYGGWEATYMLSDTDFLDWGGSSVDASMTAASSATPTSAHLEWNVESATGPHAAVYRKAPGGDWTALGVAEVDANSRLVYDDSTVQPGTSYSYMMVVGSERGETFGGQTTVVVPAAVNVGSTTAQLALRGTSPNPVVDRMSVSFALESNAPASLQLLDVVGRSLVSREVGALGAGPHQVDLAASGHVSPGLYFLRLVQAGHMAISRVVVVGSSPPILTFR